MPRRQKQTGWRRTSWPTGLDHHPCVKRGLQNVKCISKSTRWWLRIEQILFKSVTRLAIRTCCPKRSIFVHFTIYSFFNQGVKCSFWGFFFLPGFHEFLLGFPFNLTKRLFCVEIFVYLNGHAELLSYSGTVKRGSDMCVCHPVVRLPEPTGELATLKKLLMLL